MQRWPQPTSCGKRDASNRPPKPAFYTASGILTADRAGDRIELDFPANPPKPSEPPDGLLDALGIAAVYVGRTSADPFIEADHAAAVRAASPDFRRLRPVSYTHLRAHET